MMNPCFLKAGLVLSAACAVLFGCSKPDASSSNPSEPNRPATAASRERLAKLHWSGKQQLSQEPGAKSLISIWQMPESAKLEGQMLDKLAVAPWRLWAGAAPSSNAPVALLRPLLKDLIQNECYLEVWGAANQPGELALAIRLGSTEAALWRNHAPAIVRAVLPQTSEVKSETNQSDVSLRGSSFGFRLTRSGNWTLLSFSPSGVSAQNSNLLEEFKSRIQRGGTPFDGKATNWLEFQIDLPRVNDALQLGWRLPREFPGCDAVVNGDGTNTMITGNLLLKQPLKLPLEPWRIPSNAIPKALTSFTAWRGSSSLLPASAAFAELRVGPMPDQLFVWSLPSFPMQSVLVVPLEKKDNRAALVQERLLTAGNAWVATNSVGQWTAIEGGAGAQWEGAPFMTPFARPFEELSGRFLGFGLIPTPLTNSVVNTEIPQRLFARTNAVYYDWEFSGPRIESWFYIGQLGRVIFGRGQLPSEGAATLWLKSLQPKLSNSGTVVSMLTPTTLAFERKATVGLTAFELHLLSDWLESPTFPAGLHTTKVAMKRKLSAPPKE
jgi:hypothetical protein